MDRVSNCMRQWIKICEEIAPKAFQKAIDTIAKKFGVSIDAEIYNGDIRLWEIMRPSKSLPGSGALAIRAIQEIAAEINIPIALAAADGDPDLIAYYIKLGFRAEGRQNSETWLESYRKEWFLAGGTEAEHEAIVMRWNP